MPENDIVKIDWLKKICAIVVLIECAIANKHIIAKDLALLTGLFREYIFGGERMNAKHLVMLRSYIIADMHIVMYAEAPYLTQGPHISIRW